RALKARKIHLRNRTSSHLLIRNRRALTIRPRIPIHSRSSANQNRRSGSDVAALTAVSEDEFAGSLACRVSGVGADDHGDGGVGDEGGGLGEGDGGCGEEDGGEIHFRGFFLLGWVA
ncbi:hypothetical protein P280DRAFT_508947, partial [Massarina eburnea CBS 473.64]